MRGWFCAAGLKDIVRPWRLSGVVVRPLNFTVRPPMQAAAQVTAQI
jgi:hypothetical protein